MALGVRVLRDDGSAEVVAIFKDVSARSQVDDIVLGIIQRGFTASVTEDVEWPFDQGLPDIWREPVEIPVVPEPEEIPVDPEPEPDPEPEEEVVEEVVEEPVEESDGEWVEPDPDPDEDL